jgi:hypothetical protein
MKTSISSRGFALVEACVAVVAVVGLGLVGYTVYKDNQSSLKSSAGQYDSSVTSGSSAPSSSTSSPTSTATPTVPAVKNEQSLNQVEAALDSVNPSSSNAADSNQLSSQTNF